MPGKKYQYWCATTNDPNIPLEANSEIGFIVWQPEYPPGLHWHRQIYVEFKKQHSTGGAWKALGFPQIKGKKSEFYYKVFPRKGTKAQAAAYCCSTWWCSTCHVGDHTEQHHLGIWNYTGDVEKKTSTHDPTEEEPEPKTIEHMGCKGIEDKGKFGPSHASGKPNVEGKSNGKHSGGKGGHDSQEKIIEAIRAGAQRAEIFEKFGNYCARYHAWVCTALTLYAPQRRWKPHVVWLWGDAGVNKSRMAKAVCSDSTYHKSPDSKWWDGYSGHHVVVFDDLRKSTFTFGHLLVLLDRFSCAVEFKGGMTPLLAKVIVVTCSRPHDVLWQELGGTENENLRQLTRRIDTELHVHAGNVDEQKRVVHQMRAAVQRLKNPANWDGEDEIFGSWDSNTPLVPPMFQKRPRPEGEAESPPPEPKRTPPRWKFPKAEFIRLTGGGPVSSSSSETGTSSSSGDQTPAEPASSSSGPARSLTPASTDEFDPHEAKRRFERRLAGEESGNE
jgi:hypothetical protein